MEARRAEANSLLPITFNRKIPSTRINNDYEEREANQDEVLSEQISDEIKALTLLNGIDKKILILKGGYGCGKTSLLKRIYEKVGTDVKKFPPNSLWFAEMNGYSSVESTFEFLAEKAELHGVRESSQLLRTTTVDFKARKNAAVKVLYHCTVFFIDNLDASGNFDFGFLDEIACKDVIFLITSTENLAERINATKVFEIPKGTFHKPLATACPKVTSSDQASLVCNFSKNLGPFFSSVLMQAIRVGTLSIDEALEAASNSKRQYELVEDFFLEILRKLPEESRNVLLSVVFMRTDLPIKDEKLFAPLLQLKLLKKSEVEENKWTVKVPNCVWMVLRKLEKANKLMNDNKKAPSALELWTMLLPPILQDLVKQAEQHAWPFIPEAWQYKDVIGEEEKYNLKDVIHKKSAFSDLDEIDILKECLFSSLVEESYPAASAILFVMDRFIYWQGLSNMCLNVANYIGKKSPNTAIAPQVVIRKVRVMKNNGDIQGADKALNLFMESKKKLGHWVFKTNADHQLVMSVCVQIKGDIFRGLGLWTRAASDLIQSIFGFKSLPKVDIKGWAASLSLLADSFQYMSLSDFIQEMKPKFQLSSNHPILEAIKCVNEAAQLSIYSPLFFAKNKRRAGELLLIYSKILPENSVEVEFYLKYAATELMEGLKCHTSIASLESREQFYEFVFCVYKLSEVLTELFKLNKNASPALHESGKALLALSMKLYNHYCAYKSKIQHDTWSNNLVKTTMLLLNLPPLPANEGAAFPVVSAAQLGNNSSKVISSKTQMPSAVKLPWQMDAKGSQEGSTNEENEAAEEEGQSRIFQNQSTVATEDSQFQHAITASDEIHDGGRVNNRDATTASSGQGSSATSQEEKERRFMRDEHGEFDMYDKTTASDEVDDSERSNFRDATTASSGQASFRAQSTIATEDVLAMGEANGLREEVERLNITNTEKIGFKRILEQKFVHSEMSVAADSIAINKEWRENSPYLHGLSTDTSEVTGRGSNEEAERMGDRGEKAVSSVENRDGGEDSGIRNKDEEDDSGIGNFSSKTTYLTEEDYMSNDIFKKRMRTTMATIEGNFNTREKDKLQIESTLNIIKHLKVKVCIAKVWRYDPLTLAWSNTDTLAYIGDKLELGEKKGACRDAFMVEYVTQEEPMGRYVGKQYKLEKYKDNPRSIQQYKQDVVCQVTSRYYATLFSQKMFRKGMPFGQVQFLPAALLELTEVTNDPEKYYNVEPYMAGNFTKITNNLSWVEQRDVHGKDLLLAFSHFSYHASKCRIIIVDIQGWTSRDKSGATFLTDPQIHTIDKLGYGTANRGKEGFDEFWASQHPKCNDICTKLGLKRPTLK